MKETPKITSALPEEPEVRKKLDELMGVKNEEGAKLMDVLTDPDVPMSMRLKLQDRYVWPMAQELLEDDLEEERKKGGGENGEEKGDGAGGERSSGSKGEGDKKGGKGKKAGKQKPKDAKAEKPDPNDVFKDAYKRAKEKIPEAVPLEDVKKEFEKWKKSRAENPLDQADKDYAEKLGVKKEDLQRYREIVKQLEEIKNPETGESVVEELRSLIRRIVAERMKPAPAPRYPVEEGEELVDPAELVARVKAGELEPKAWETYEIKEKRGKKFGEVEITLVCDRSVSMQGDKLIQQQRAVVLMMEALKEFADICEEERVNMEEPLEVRSEIYSFQESADDKKPLKKISKELSEKERIEVASALSSAPGGTTDFIPLETILAGIGDEPERKIKEGEIKKIVIVFTDGDSNDAERVQRALKNLREKGVISVGVGITEDGRSALDTYAPDARLAETAEKLPIVLADLLKKELRELNG